MSNTMSETRDMEENSIKSDIEQPVIFLTVDKEVYESTTRTGSIWLRSCEYYQNIENLARKDGLEGSNGTKALFQLYFKPENAVSLRYKGAGIIGCSIVPHYIFSMHGTSITNKWRAKLGGYTFGIRSVSELAADIAEQVKKQIVVLRQPRYGPVHYQYTPLTMSHDLNNAAIVLNGNPGVAIKSIDTDVLRKLPVEPFIQHDEWRIVIFTSGYLGGDAHAPLKINLDPNHFYEYIKPRSTPIYDTIRGWWSRTISHIPRR